jgi:hypothetical protein
MAIASLCRKKNHKTSSSIKHRIASKTVYNTKLNSNLGGHQTKYVIS